jgi:Spy/CpxP family protein refolding chaperone
MECGRVIKPAAPHTCLFCTAGVWHSGDTVSTIKEHPMKPSSAILARLLIGVAVIAVVMLAAGTACAQPPRMTAEERTKNLTEKLTLSTDQAAKVLAIYKRSEEEMKKLFEASEGDREAMRETMRAHRDKANKEIAALLTGEQKVKFEELRKQGPPQRMGRRSDGN